MAGTERTLKIKDEFSSVLQNYIDKLSQSIAKEEALSQVATAAQDAVANWTAKAQEWADAADGVMKNEDSWAEILSKVSTESLKAQDDVSVLAGAFREFSKSTKNWNDIEIAFARFNEELAKNGGYWTEAAEQFDKYDLLMDHSFDKLVKNGLIVVDGQEQFLAKLNEITAAAEAADAEAEAATQRRIKELEEQNAQLEKILNIVPNIARKAGNMVSSFLGIDKAAKRFRDLKDGVVKMDNPMRNLSKTLAKMAVSFFSISKLVQYFKAQVGRAPEKIMAPFTKLKETINDTFAGTTVAAMSRMTAGIERLNQALSSPNGQKFARAMETIGRIIGDILTIAFERLAQFIEWVGEHIEPIAMAAGVAFAIWAVHMTALAVATAAANLPLIAMVGLVAAVIAALYKTGTTAEDVFGYIGGALAGLYAFAYNVVADIYNAFASLGEFLANVFRDPVSEAGLLFVNLADVALGALERVAKAIDKIFGTSMGQAVASWREGLAGFASKLETGDRYTIERMGTLDYAEYVAKGFDKGSAVGAGLSDYALRTAEAQDIKAIAKNTGAIKDTLQEEDLTALIDMAERQFVSQVNLTAQTPVITVNGANTGNTEADRNALARAIAQILTEQVASMPTMPSPAFYGGRG